MTPQVQLDAASDANGYAPVQIDTAFIPAVEDSVGDTSRDGQHADSTDSDDESCALGVPYCDFSDGRGVDILPSSFSIEKYKGVSGLILLGSTWEEYAKPCPGIPFPSIHPPWIGWHAEKGNIISFPVAVEVGFQSKANYLRVFKNPLYDPSNVPESWYEQFPVFPKKNDGVDTITIFRFARALVVHCYLHHVYCPSIHTVTRLEPRGWWYKKLSPAAKQLLKSYWSTAIFAGLQDEKTGLVDHPQLRDIFHGLTNDGYTVFMNLLAHGDHPHLQVFSTPTPKPRQKNLSLVEYFDLWHGKLLIDLVRGVTPSDRAFVHWVINGLNNSMRSLGERILNRMYCENRYAPLPYYYAPSHLFLHFTTEAQALGLCTSLRPRFSDNVDAVTYEAVEQMVLRAMKKYSGQFQRPISPSHRPTQSQSSKQQPHRQCCYLCDADHLIRDCPKFPEICRELPRDASKLIRCLVNAPNLPEDDMDNVIRALLMNSGVTSTTDDSL